MKIRIVKILVALLVAFSICGSTVFAVVNYIKGSKFQAFNTNRDLKNNQVLFPDSEITSDSEGNKEEDNSSWENDDKNDNETKVGNDSDYLFKNVKKSTPSKNVAVDDKSVAKPDGLTPDEVYNIVKDPKKAQVVLPNNNNKNENKNNGGNGNGKGNNNGGNGNGENGTGHIPSGPSDSNLNVDNNKKDDNKNNNGSHASSAKDPESQKNNPSNDNTLPSDNYNESITPATPSEDDGSNQSVVIEKPYFDGKTYIYYGQSIDKLTVFNSLETYVHGADGVSYLWGTNDYNVYIKINSVSFDNGKSWIEDFPVTVPEKVTDGTMLISVSYRFSKKGKWIEKKVSYEIEDSRILVLNSVIKNENEVIDTSSIINYDPFQQYLKKGSMVNLFRYQFDFLGYGKITKLFPGWTEDGKLVPWFYTVDTGRHILEPSELVDLDSSYTVQIALQWMSEDYDVGYEYSNLCYLQTLTDFDDKSVVRSNKAKHSSKLSIPKYIQAVDIDTNKDIIVDYLDVPDTVLYINTVGSGLKVYEGYNVNSNNIRYCSVNDLLMNNKKTEILGIPLKIKSIDVGKEITKVNIPGDNALTKISLKADSLENMPTINFDNLSNNCVLEVKNSLWENFLIENKNAISEHNLFVSSASKPEVSYTIANNMIISNGGAVHSVFDNGSATLYLPDGATSIESGAVDGNENATSLVMPSNGNVVDFDKNSLKGSTIKTVICYSDKQFNSALKNVPDDVSVAIVTTSKEGYEYCRIIQDDIESCVLFSATKDIIEFDGTVTDKEGNKLDLTEIGAGAFSKCSKLRWVTLPESVYEIDEKAFYGCNSLEGILINTTYSITIGNKAFDNCSSLRFIASNALYGILKDDYDFRLSDNYSVWNQYLFAPTGALGYSANWLNFTEESDIVKYEIIDVGDNGKVLYGVNSTDSAWIALRSGKIFDSNVVLPESTYAFWNFAMADTVSDSGIYKIDFSNFWSLAFYDGAFEGSQLGGEVNLPQMNYLSRDIFVNCVNIEKVSFVYLSNYVDLYQGTFTGCDNLTSIEIGNFTPPVLVVDYNTPFQFNYSWTREEECQKLKIIVPEGSEQDYIKNWRYSYAGFGGEAEKTPYTQMWNYYRAAHIDYENEIYPTVDEVDGYVEENLLTAENLLRSIFGLEQVDYPTNLYHYTVSSDNYITLRKAPKDVTYAFIFADDIGLYSGWSVDYIASGCFSQCKNLEFVSLPNNLLGISAGAFDGVESEKITIISFGDTPPELMDFEIGTPFDFGIDYNKISFSILGEPELFIKSWIFSMAGYENMAQMRTLVTNELHEKYGEDATNEMIEKEIENRLFIAENKIRTMLDGVDTIDDPEDMVGLD